MDQFNTAQYLLLIGLAWLLSLPSERPKKAYTDPSLTEIVAAGKGVGGEKAQFPGHDILFLFLLVNSISTDD